MWWKRSTLDLARRLEQELRAEDIRARRTARDRSTARLLCDSAAKLTTTSISCSRSDVLDDVQVGDVRLDERNALLGAVEVRPVSRVGQEVERDDRVVGMPLEPVVDEVRADEAGRAGDEDPHGVTSYLPHASLQQPSRRSISFRLPWSASERSRCGSASSQRPSPTSAAPRSYSAYASYSWPEPWSAATACRASRSAPA